MVTRVATPNAGGTFHLEFNGIDVTGQLTVPSTGGWQDWADLSVKVTLSPEIQIMRFWRDAGADFNVNRFTVSAAGGGCPPRIVTDGINFGVKDSRFGFDITGSGGQVVFVDASTNLVDPDWSSVVTNTLTGYPCYFSDPEWTRHAARFYRLRWP